MHGNRHARGYGSAWERLRKRVLRRDKYLCQIQTHCEGRAANEVDHRVPKAAGGTDEPDNLQAACSRCHKAKTAQERRSA